MTLRPQANGYSIGFFLFCYSICLAEPGLSAACGWQDTLPVDHSSETAADHADPASPLAGHSFHAEVFNEGPRQAAYLMPGTGEVNFPVSTTDIIAQQFFNQGVGQLHGFWYFEAERSFRQAAALDGQCPMFYWGMAMANLKNPDRASKFIAQAMERIDTATSRERKWIEAVKTFCTTKDADDKVIAAEKRAQRYTRDLEEVIFMQPEDIEAKAFLVGHLWENQRQALGTVSHVAVNALLQQIFDVAPLHPAHHYRIHLWDQRDAKQALESAALCGLSAPGIAHMWHMPGHIYSKLDRYHDAVWQMEASARVDHHQMMRDGVLPDQIHNYAHNNEWLIRNLSKIGRAHDALQLADNMLTLPRHPAYNIGDKGSGRYGRQRSLQTLTHYRMWDELLQRADRIFWDASENPTRQWEKWQHVGMAAAFLNEGERVEESRSALQQALAEKRAKKASTDAEAIANQQDDAAVGESEQQAEESAGKQVEEKTGEETATENTDQTTETSREVATDSGEKTSEPTSQAPARRQPKKSSLDKEIETLEKAIASIAAVQAAIEQRWEDALALADKASGLDAGLKAEWHAAAGHSKKAWEMANKEVQNLPNDLVPLANRIYIGHRILGQGETLVSNSAAGDPKSEDATTAESSDETPPEPPSAITWEMLRTDFEHLRKLAAHADLDTPLLSRLELAAAALDYPGDWRLPHVEANDIGERPPLESMGPLSWSPYLAPQITVLDSQGVETRPLTSTGKAKIVMFYLGFGCLHCMEQLQKFSPHSEAFSQHDIEVLAISCETLELLQQGLENCEVPLAMPLHADENLAAFQAFRCYDDFENQPLHGTFLLAPDGRVLWQDIGHEPFMDVDFMMTEAQRLLEVWQSGTSAPERAEPNCGTLLN